MPSGPMWVAPLNCCTARHRRSPTTDAAFSPACLTFYGHPVPLSGGRTRHPGKGARGQCLGRGRYRHGYPAQGPPVDGVQFHPEAVLTAGGHRLLANWLVSCGLPGAVEAVPAS